MKYASTQSLIIAFMLSLFVVSSATITSVTAETTVSIGWADLIPEAEGADTDAQMSVQMGIVQHGQIKTPVPDAPAAKVTSEYNGKTIRIPGYMVPLEYDGTGTKEFLLVPYVGACIHVPPPPANQLILVTSETPYQAKGLFEPVFVTGMFGTAATKTQLADVGYALSADKIEPYQ